MVSAGPELIGWKAQRLLFTLSLELGEVTQGKCVGDGRGMRYFIWTLGKGRSGRKDKEN